MSVLSKPEFHRSHGLLDNDIFQKLLLNIHLWQQRVYDEWNQCKVVWNNTGFFEEFVVSDHRGNTTTIPLCEGYDYTWQRSGISNPLNPFKMKWLNFDAGQFYMNYLESILYTLQEQVLLWEVSSGSSLVYWGFATFVNQLTYLHQFIVAYLKATTLGLSKRSEFLEG